MPTTRQLLPVVALPLIALTAATLAACGSDDGDGHDRGRSVDGASATGSTTGPAGDPATRDVETDFGTVTVPTEPQAALGMYTTDVDILITLGIPLATSQPLRDTGYSDFPSFFPQEELAGIETFGNFPEYNYEAILAAEPDFILNGLGYEPEVVERLPDIAPTYSIDAFDGSDWREKFERIATDLDRTDEYEAWLSSYQQKVDDVRARLDEAGVDPVVAPVTYNDGTVRSQCYGTICLVFEDLGLRVSPLAHDGGTELSLEELQRLSDVDVAFWPATPDDDTLPTELTSNELWNTLPFVANDAYHRYDLEMMYGSPSGHEAFLDVVADALLT